MTNQIRLNKNIKYHEKRLFNSDFLSQTLFSNFSQKCVEDVRIMNLFSKFFFTFSKVILNMITFLIVFKNFVTLCFEFWVEFLRNLSHRQQIWQISYFVCLLCPFLWVPMLVIRESEDMINEPYSDPCYLLSPQCVPFDWHAQASWRQQLSKTQREVVRLDCHILCVLSVRAPSHMHCNSWGSSSVAPPSRSHYCQW